MARGGFPNFGGGGNMNNLMKQAQKFQKQMEDMQSELENKEFSATAGGEAITEANSKHKDKTGGC
mgnify:CR=1 FL=1